MHQILERSLEREPTSLSHLLDRCTQLTHDLAHLPAVPTIDWCDRAAKVFGSVAQNEGAGAVVVDTIVTGEVRAVLATGACAGTASPRDIAQQAKTSIRFALETLSQGHVLPGMAESSVLRNAESGVLHSESLGEEIFVSKWGLSRETRMIWSACPIAGRITGRTLASYVAAHRDVESLDSARMLLQSCVTHAARLASHALVCVDSDGNIAWLTPREQDVLERLVEGKSVREISDEIERSQHTVHDYVKSLHRKLGANSRGELVAKAIGHAHTAW